MVAAPRGLLLCSMRLLLLLLLLLLRLYLLMCTCLRSTLLPPLRLLL